jgi:hypothetical protein
MTQKTTKTAKKNVKVATAELIANKPVFVLTVNWEDRHGPTGPEVPQVFSNPASAREAMLKDIETYAKDLGVVDSNGQLDHESFYSINDDDESIVDLKTLLAAARKAATGRRAFYVNIDDSGTWCGWQIHQMKIQP